MNKVLTKYSNEEKKPIETPNKYDNFSFIYICCQVRTNIT